jgi:hypothetical protein
MEVCVVLNELAYVILMNYMMTIIKTVAYLDVT